MYSGVPTTYAEKVFFSLKVSIIQAHVEHVREYYSPYHSSLIYVGSVGEPTVWLDRPPADPSPRGIV